MEKFTEYATLKAKIKILTEQAEKISKDILEEMNELGEISIDQEVGKFTIAKLKRWTYPEALIQKKDELEGEFEKAKSTGDATYVEVDSLKFTPIKL